MDRLLTPEELGQTRKDWIAAGAPVTYTQYLLSAQQTMTLKAVAEYLDDYCSEETHAACKDRLLRRQCLICLMGITRCLSEGKMPGEE